MLVELSIENLGIIESSRLTFHDGFTALTGETGAGKTMLVEAINLVCGRRAEASVIRDGADEAHVEARFVRMGDDGEEEVILARTLHREGRSRAYINGRMATVAALSELGEELVDIAAQALIAVRKSKSDMKLSMKAEITSATLTGTADLAKILTDLKAVGRITDLVLQQGNEVALSEVVFAEPQ